MPYNMWLTISSCIKNYEHQENIRRDTGRMNALSLFIMVLLFHLTIKNSNLTFYSKNNRERNLSSPIILAAITKFGLLLTQE